MAISAKKEIKIRYKKSPEYKVIPATGVHGGVTPQGEIFCNLFVEYREAPDWIELEIDTVEGSSKETNREAKDYYTREMGIGVLMRADIAKSIGTWLIENANKVFSPEKKLDS